MNTIDRDLENAQKIYAMVRNYLRNGKPKMRVPNWSVSRTEKLTRQELFDAQRYLLANALLDVVPGARISTYGLPGTLGAA
jgi:hypothetical protein